MAEFRIDPSDGGIYTYEQIFAFYQDQYSPSEIGAYWQMQMAPVKGKGKGKDKGKGGYNNNNQQLQPQQQQQLRQQQQLLQQQQLQQQQLQQQQQRQGQQNQQVQQNQQMQQNQYTAEDLERFRAMMMRMQQPPEPEITEEDIEKFRSELRFNLNDRVFCNCGSRWLSGHIVGTAIDDGEDLLPYLVKTDPLPGLPSSTISVPFDEDDTCIQEVCFEPSSASQLRLIKAGTVVVNESNKPKLRFSTGDRVVCRIRNDPTDGLEQWVPGIVDTVWPELPGEKMWDLGDVSGEFPDAAPYQVALESGRVIICHRDEHTLIRREGMQPQTRVKGVSKRMEVRITEDGGKEKVDHVTGRCKKILVESSPSVSESE